jgi:hypothetical protein
MLGLLGQRVESAPNDTDRRPGRVMLFQCFQCGHFVHADGDRRPPWCPKCGADYRARSQAADAEPPLLALNPGPELLPAPRPFAAPDRPGTSRATPSAGPADSGMPVLAGISVIACVLLVLFRDAIPLVLGMGGAAVCLKVGTVRALNPGVRTGLCVGIAAFCWALAIASSAAFAFLLKH